eukprot:1186323-Prorocentrum_minimum.AAC.2
MYVNKPSPSCSTSGLVTTRCRKDRSELRSHVNTWWQLIAIVSAPRCYQAGSRTGGRRLGHVHKFRAEPEEGEPLDEEEEEEVQDCREQAGFASPQDVRVSMSNMQQRTGCTPPMRPGFDIRSCGAKSPEEGARPLIAKSAPPRCGGRLRGRERSVGGAVSLLKTSVES